MFKLLLVFSLFFQQRDVQQDTLLIGIRAKSDSVKATLYIQAARSYFNQPAVADSLGRLAFEAGKRSGNENHMGEGAFIRSFAQLRYDVPFAQQWADTAIYHFTRAKNYQWVGYAARSIGLTLNHSMKHELGIDYILKSSDGFTKSGDTALLILNHLDLSLKYHNDLSEYDLGLKYGYEALRLLELKPKTDHGTWWRVINAIAINHDDKNESEKAIQFHKRNFAYCKDNLDMFANTNNNLGNTYRKMKQAAKAEAYFVTALELQLRDVEDATNEYDMATVYNNLSAVNWDLGRKAKARMFRDSAVLYSERSKNVEKLMDTYFTSYRMSEENGEYKDAAIFLKKFIDVKDSVFNAEKAKLVYEAETKYETQRKQQQIALLESQSTVKDLELRQSRVYIIVLIALLISVGLVIYLFSRRARDKRRLTSLQEREAFQRQQFSAVLEAEENERRRVAKDLHDGIGQLLSTVKLSLSAIDETSSSDTQRLLSNSMHVLDEATKEVRAISHNLMPATLTQIGLLAALDDLSQKVNEAKSLNIKLNASGLDQRLPQSTEIAVYRVVQEVVNNMMKHSKADTISIDIHRVNDKVRLSISDNGIGFEKELIGKSTGLGWKNIFSRISMLNGGIEVDSRPGAGTQVNIEFALA